MLEKKRNRRSEVSTNYYQVYNSILYRKYFACIKPLKGLLWMLHLFRKSIITEVSCKIQPWLQHSKLRQQQRPFLHLIKMYGLLCIAQVQLWMPIFYVVHSSSNSIIYHHQPCHYLLSFLIIVLSRPDFNCVGEPSSDILMQRFSSFSFSFLHCRPILGLTNFFLIWVREPGS